MRLFLCLANKLRILYLFVYSYFIFWIHLSFNIVIDVIKCVLLYCITNTDVTCSPSSPSNSSVNPTGATVTVTPASTGSMSSAGISGASSPRPTSRKGGIIFPSVKNKPIVGNNTFASEIVANYKDVKVSLIILTS